MEKKRGEQKKDKTKAARKNKEKKDETRSLTEENS